MEQGRELLRKRDLPYLEKLLGEASAGGYLCGDFSLADTAVMPLAMVLEVDQLALGDFPQVEKYIARLRERKSYRAISPSTKVADAAAAG
jgi:glutathione S-transferase